MRHSQSSTPLFSAQLITTGLAGLALLMALNMQGDGASYHWQADSLCVLITLVFCVLYPAYKNSLYLPNHPITLWFTAFIVWGALSMLWSPVPSESFLSTLIFLSGLLALLLGYWASEKQWQYFYNLLIVFGVVTVALTAYQAFVLHAARPAGFFLNWNTNSAFLGALLLPRCAHYIQTYLQGRHSFLLGLFLAACSFGMTLGQGRGSLLALALGLCILFFACRQQPQAKRAITFTCAWLLGGFILGDFLHNGLLWQRLVSTFESTKIITQLLPSLTDSSGSQINTPIPLNAEAQVLHSLGSGREFLWAAGWKMYLDRPWLGWGLSLFHWLYPHYRPAVEAEYGHYVHNDYLQFLIELGPIGLLLCLGWVFSTLKLAQQLYAPALLKSSELEPLALALACGAMLLHTSVDFHLYQPAMLMLLGAYLGHLCRHVQNKQGKLSILTLQKHLGATSYYSLLSVFGLLALIKLMTLSYGFQIVDRSNSKKSVATSFSQCEQAQQLLPSIEYFQSCQGWLVLNAIKNEPERLPLDKRDELISYAIKSLDTAINNNPLNAFTLTYKGELLGLLPGKQQAAIDILKQALLINPYQLETRTTLAGYLLNQQQKPEAYQLLADSLNKTYDASPAEVESYWQAVSQALYDTQANAALKQKVNEQLALINRMIEPNKRIPILLDPEGRKQTFQFTLPDLGWQPSALTALSQTQK